MGQAWILNIHIHDILIVIFRVDERPGRSCVVEIGQDFFSQIEYSRPGRGRRTGLRPARDVRPRRRLRGPVDGRGPARSQDRARARGGMGGVPRGAGLSVLARLRA